MSTPEPRRPIDPDDVSIPALLRAARTSYARAIVAELAGAGYDDLPRNGPFVLAGMANWDAPAAELLAGLEISKQAASQLVDVLVVRGYLTRDVDPDDRRRLVIALTERGRAAGAAIRTGVLAVDGELAELVTPEQLAGMRAGLFALAQIRERRPRVGGGE